MICASIGVTWDRVSVVVVFRVPDVEDADGDDAGCVVNSDFDPLEHYFASTDADGGVVGGVDFSFYWGY